VLDAVARHAETLRIAPGLDPEARIGPLISQSHLERVLGYVALGRAEGAHIVTGGERPGGALAGGYFMRPTILTNVAEASALTRDEIFGPVLVAFPFDTEEEALARANALPFGLAAGVWTNDLARAHRMAGTLRAGVVWINTYDWFDPAVPFGGMGQSGQGRELGRQVLDHYTELKSVWVKL
ncbi:MAG: aldehyde dehydrogenase family protein, partial [Chloroflexaceae bacterium]